MKKEKVTLQLELQRRKHRIPNKLYFNVYRLIMSGFVTPKYKPHYEYINRPRECKTACFVIWNHLSRLDHAYLMEGCYPRPMSMLAGYNEFFRSHLHTVFKMESIIPKKIFNRDPHGIRAISQIIKQGGCVAFSPEGMATHFGFNQPIVPGTGHFLKHYGVPVYCMDLKGQYLTQNKHCMDIRPGRTEAKMYLLFTPEDLKTKTDEEIDNIINETFRHDEYEWSYANNIKWKLKGRGGVELDQMLYKCPKCGAELNMTAEKDYIKCNSCGNGTTIDDYYRFHPFDDTCVIPESPSKWVNYQRMEEIKAIRKDPNYSLSFDVDLGYLPPYEYVKNKETTVRCGKGTFTIDHSGVHYKGTKLGEEFNLDLNYKEIFSYAFPKDMSRFGIFLDNDYFEFIPSVNITTKALLVTEEMHRLHVNYWKNFKWNDYMYEGMELGIDNKNN